MLLAIAALAALALSAPAAAWHSNGNCTPGSYTQTWNAPVDVISPQAPIVDECILVQANITVQAGGELRFRDTLVVFDNELGNFTLFVNQSGLLEFRDDDGNPGTNDRSKLTVLNDTVIWTGFFFGNGAGARVYFNDTDIVGGGLPGTGLSPSTAFFVESPSDFAWNRITHDTPSSGLVLANYSKALAIPSYGVSGNAVAPFAYGLVLDRCVNVTITAFTNPRGLGSTGLLVNEGQNITVRNSTANVAGTGFRFVLTTGVVIEDAFSIAHNDNGFVLDHVDGAVLNRVNATPPTQGHYGLRIDASTRVEVRDLDLQKHDNADLMITDATRFVNFTNVFIRQLPLGSGIRVVGDGDVDHCADINFRNLVVTRKGPAGGFAVSLEKANRVLFAGYTIQQSSGQGFRVETSTGVRFQAGAVTSNVGGVGFSNSGDLSIVDSTLSQNAGGGLTVGGGSFTLENVTMRNNNGWSIRSGANALMTGDSAVRNSTLEGVTGAVIELVLVSGSTGTLEVSNSQFVRLTNAPQPYFALNLDGFQRVRVDGSVFYSYAFRVVRTSEVTFQAPLLDIILLPANTTLFQFDQVGTLRMDGVRFGDDPVTGKVGTVINSTGLIASASFLNMSLPRSDYGLNVQGFGGSFTASVEVRNVRMTALVDAVVCRVVGSVTIDRLTNFASVNAVSLSGSGTSNRFTVTNSTLQAGAEGIRTLTDLQGVLRVDNITFDRTNSTPSVGVVLSYAQEAHLSALRVSGLPVGVDLLDVRYVWLRDTDFVDNAWGLRMRSNPLSRTDINWTIDRPTLVSNAHLVLRGDVWVLGTDLNVTSGSTVEMYADNVNFNSTRFHLEGASCLLLDRGSRMVGREGSVANGTLDGRFTVELSATACVDIRDAVLDRLGLVGAVPAVQKGLLIQSRDTTFTNVSFLHSWAAIRGVDVDITVWACRFTGIDGPGQDLAVDVSGGVLTVGGGTTFSGTDGVRLVSGSGAISNASFENVGAALSTVSSSATFVDSSLRTSSEVAHATTSSNVLVCRVNTDSVYQAVFADTSSTVRYCDSALFLTRRFGEVRGGGLVEFENVFVEEVGSDGKTAYVGETPGSTFRAYWTTNVAVTSCPTSNGSAIAGASVQVVDRLGQVVFTGTTQADGRAGPVRLLHFESTNNQGTVHSPFTFGATLGPLYTSATFDANQTSDIALCLDDRPPEVLLLLPVGLGPGLNDLPPTRNSSITIRGSTWDNISDLAQGSPCLSVDGGECVALPRNFDLARPLHEGMNTFEIVSVDNFGNRANLTIRVVRDTTPPVFESCTPSFSHRTATAGVDLVCQMGGGPVDPPTISGIVATGALIDAQQRLHAHVTLGAGFNAFRVTVVDALGNPAEASFSWLLDLESPEPTLTATYNTTVTRDYGVFLRGTVPPDTVSVAWDGLDVAFSGGSINVEWLNLSEGRNERTLLLTDEVGNVWASSLWLDVDTQTNCTLFAPQDGLRRQVGSVAVGGACDPDVTVSISGLVGALTPGPDGKWSADVQLHEGANPITVKGTDSHGATWEVTVTVYFDATSDGPLPPVVIVLVIAAVVVFGMAIYLMRRPRRPQPEPVWKPATGAQKAPPRQRPPPLRLPEAPDDRSPGPPQGPPPPRTPPRR